MALLEQANPSHRCKSEATITYRHDTKETTQIRFCIDGSTWAEEAEKRRRSEQDPRAGGFAILGTKTAASFSAASLVIKSRRLWVSDPCAHRFNLFCEVGSGYSNSREGRPTPSPSYSKKTVTFGFCATTLIGQHLYVQINLLKN
jgi:hypothetical protein